MANIYTNQKPKSQAKGPKSKVIKTETIKVKVALEDKCSSAKTDARLAKVAEYDKPKPIEEPKTTLEAIRRLSNKRSKLCGLLIKKKEFGPRAQGVEECKAEIERLNKDIEKLNLQKVQEDAAGR